MIGGDHRIEAGVCELLAPGAGRLQLLEVAHHLPVVVARVSDVELGETVGMERTGAHPKEVSELVPESHHHRFASFALRPGATRIMRRPGFR
jgi:hypothetical protein